MKEFVGVGVFVLINDSVFTIVFEGFAEDEGDGDIELEEDSDNVYDDDDDTDIKGEYEIEFKGEDDNELELDNDELIDELPLIDLELNNEKVEIGVMLGGSETEIVLLIVELKLGEEVKLREGESEIVLVIAELILEEPVFEGVLELFEEYDNGISNKVINICTPENTTEPSVINVILRDGVFEIYFVVFAAIVPALLRTFPSNEL